MRLTQKGGTWKNAEDEVLKAAVMKYGLNNWSRVASLLVRKTARQCKSRWYEWLDPSVKKTPWSKTEDEKLLHLVKLFPTQWKTIAEGVGRTAIQCTERYYELIDLANGRVPTEDDPRKLRPGEIDPNPEAKPARADPKDLDEDEKEMLAEARARLANTRGKKAKRKAREKQLEEARRVAMLQKRRELKAAGISVGGFHSGRRKGEIDYQNEIPFEHKPLKGFYAVGNEETPQLRNDAANMRLQQIEEHQARERQRKLKLQDRRTLKKLHEQNLPAAMEKIAEQSNPFLYRKRDALTLPEPSVTDSELGALAATIQKATSQAQGLSSQRSQLLVGVAGTEHLLPTANLPKGATPATALAAMTPMVNATATGVLRQEAIMQEARNALARQEMSTPLEGGLSHEEEGHEKKKRSRRAPMTPITTTSVMTGVATPVTAPGVRKGKRPRTLAKKLTVEDILSSLPDAEGDVVTSAIKRFRSESQEPESDMHDDDFVEDERDKEVRLRREKEEFLDILGMIHSRVKMMTEFYPRPMDLPEDPDSIVGILEEARVSPSDTTEVPLFYRRLSERTELSLEQCRDITRMLDKEVAELIVQDNEFLPPEEHLKVFSDPSTVDKSVSIAKSFLTFNAQRYKEIPYNTLVRAGQLIDEEAARLAALKRPQSDDNDDMDEGKNKCFRQLSTSCLDLGTAEKLLLFVNGKYVAVSSNDIMSNATMTQAFIEHVRTETACQQKLLSLKEIKLKKLQAKEEKMTAGYKALQRERLAKLDKLYERRRTLEQFVPVCTASDLDELIARHRGGNYVALTD